MNVIDLYKRSFVFSLLALLILTVIFPRFLGIAPIVLAASAFLAYRPVFGVWPKLSRAPLIWACTFTGLALASSLWAFDSGIALERGLKILTLLPAGALLMSMALAQDASVRALFRKTLPWVVIVMGVILMIDIYTHGMIYENFHNMEGEKNVLLSKMNRSVVIFVLSSFVVWPLLLYTNTYGKMRKSLCAALLILTLLILYKTESQSAQLGFVVAAVFMLFFPYSKKTAWHGLTAFCVAGMLAAPWIAQAMFAYLPPLLADNAWFNQGYALPRMEIWDFVARRALESPLYGSGAEAAKAIPEFDTARIYHQSAQILHPHNFVLQLWIEFGIIGVALTGGFFSWIFMALSRLGVESARQFLPALMAAMVIGAMTYGLWQGWWLGLFIMLAVFGVLSSEPAPRLKSSGSD